jgi:hypothetical protein
VVKKTPFTSDPSSTDLGLESPSYKNHKTTTPAFRGFRVFRGPITTQCVSSVKIRVHPWRNTIRGTPRPQRGRGVGGEGPKSPNHRTASHAGHHTTLVAAIDADNSPQISTNTRTNTRTRGLPSAARHTENRKPTTLSQQPTKKAQARPAAVVG